MLDYYFVLFPLFAIAQRSQWRIWLLLFVTSTLLFVNKEIFPKDYNSMLYYNRSLVTFIGCVVMLRMNTLHSYYQGAVFILTLILFGLLEYDVSTGANLVYDNYEGWINGIIFIKFMGIFVGISTGYRDISTDNYTNFFFRKRHKKS